MLGPLRVVVPSFIRRSYALKFVLALLVLGLSVGAVGVVGTEQIASEVEQRTHTEQTELADKEARNVRNSHEKSVLVTEVLSDADQVQGDDVPLAYLHTQREKHDEAYQIHVIDVSEERVISSTVRDASNTSFDEYEGAPWTDLESYEESSDEYNDPSNYWETTRYVGAYVSDDDSIRDVPVLGYAKPVTGSEWRDRYVVYEVTSESHATSMINEDGAIAYMVDEDTGEILADPSDQSTLESYDHMDVIGGQNGSVEMGVPGENLAASIDAANENASYEDGNYIASYAQVSGEQNWTVVVHTPTERAFGFVYAVQRYGIYASIVAVAFVVLIGGVIGRNTSRSIDRLTTKAKRMEEGDLDVEFDTRRIDSIGRLYDGFANMRDSLRDRIEETREARDEAERARAETKRLNDHLMTKAESYSDVMEVCADGDLTARMDPESESEAMREIAAEFNDMIAEMERTIASLDAFADEVATSSEEVTASSEEVRSASEQVTESIQEISNGADRQNESLQSVDQEMNALSTTIEEIASSSNEVADIAERTAAAGERGRRAAREAIEGMDEIEAESSDAVEAIDRLEDEMEQIDELVEFIREVAEQTNMLALNANIEASRSGASDEGFAVVAEEVKELSSDTKEAAADIEERIEGIKEQTDRTATEVQGTSDRVAEHADAVERAVDALEEIAGYAEETNDGIQEISAATEQQAASTQEVVAMVDEAATVAEETSAESETVAAAAEEQTTALTEVSQSANDLATQASELSTALARFDTDVEGATRAESLEELSEDAAVVAENTDTEDEVDVEPSGSATATAEHSSGEATSGSTAEETDHSSEPDRDDADEPERRESENGGTEFEWGDGSNSFPESETDD